MILGSLVKLMRNVFLILIMFTLTQCKKESISETNTTISIIGKWQLASSTYKRYSKGVVTQTGIDDLKLVGYTIIFKNDSTATSTDNVGNIEKFNFKLIGNSIKGLPIGINYVPFILTSNKLEWTYFSQGTIDNGTQVTETLNKIN